MDSQKLAHDLDEKIWRSEDVHLSTYIDNAEKVEIKTPFQKSKDPKDDTLIKITSETTFSMMKIDERIVDDLKRCGFFRPSPIQTTCLPLARLGVDLIAQSKSGTGKTMVFVVCALEMIVKDLDLKPCPKVLILAPTREVAVQIANIIESLTSNWKNFGCYKAIGGTKVSADISQLFVSQIIVGTPGRICCLLENDFLKPQSIRLFILDECDKLMEENFKRQIDKIYNSLPASKQMIVTSATLSEQMINYLSRYMRDPALIRLNADKPALVAVHQYLLQVEGHSLDYMNFESKIDSLLYLLKNVRFQQCFIFLNYQTRVKYLYEKIHSKELAATYITGDMSQKERLQSIELFRRKKFKILVSTDLTSRGIDIESVDLVINMDIPLNYETYLHRIGRSGRYGSPGIAITIIGNQCESEKFSSIIAECDSEIKTIEIPLTFDLWQFMGSKKLQNRLELNQRLKLYKMDPFIEKLKFLHQKYENESMVSTEDSTISETEIKSNDEMPKVLKTLRLIASELKKRKIKKNEGFDETTNENLTENRAKNENQPKPISEIKKSHQNPKLFKNLSLSSSEGLPSRRENKNSLQHDHTPYLGIGYTFPVTQLFRQTFLNISPRRLEISENYPFETNDNLYIFRYLLKGGQS